MSLKEIVFQLFHPLCLHGGRLTHFVDGVHVPLAVCKELIDLLSKDFILFVRSLLSSTLLLLRVWQQALHLGCGQVVLSLRGELIVTAERIVIFGPRPDQIGQLCAYLTLVISLNPELNTVFQTVLRVFDAGATDCADSAATIRSGQHLLLKCWL